MYVYFLFLGWIDYWKLDGSVGFVVCVVLFISGVGMGDIFVNVYFLGCVDVGVCVWLFVGVDFVWCDFYLDWWCG